MGSPVSLEARAASLRVEDAAAVSPEAQMQLVAGDQNQRSAVTGVSGELAGLLDVSKTQAPGKILSRGGLPADLEGDATSVSPGHAVIGFAPPHPVRGLPHMKPMISGHCDHPGRAPSASRGRNRCPRIGGGTGAMK